ncbi:MAG: DUF3298 and DUF4163 domain-containing protein [Bacteroidales bacterium]|nr:DUF3298 and DUF4163 domain-containing protein [Bacteroidales bacterium]HOI31608.1 DUF3298 and DUF4163 domain-containing protein [Bacteroidales bacterium]
MKNCCQLILLLLLSVQAITARSQQSFYSCFTGDNQHYEMRLHLVNANNKLQATLLLKGKSNDIEQLDLMGKVNQAGDFYLGQNFGEDTLLVGRLSNTRLEAYFKRNENDLVLMHMQAETAANHLLLNVETFEQQQFLDAARPDSPQAIYEGQLLIPNNSNAQLDSLFSLQKNGSKLQSAKLNELLQLEAETFFSDYKKLNNFEDQDSPVFQWIKSSEVAVQFNQQGIICFSTTDYVYTGGAHGLNSKWFFVFDLLNYKQLSIHDIFKTEALAVLPSFIEQSLRNSFQIESDNSLRSAGFFSDTVELSKTFWLSAAGIGFYYNSYDIAPYYFGHTPVLLPFNKIQSLLQPAFFNRLRTIQESLNPGL